MARSTPNWDTLCSIVNDNYNPMPHIMSIIGSFAAEELFGNNEHLKKMYESLKDTWIISDCDGILTDSQSQYGEGGKFGKTYGAYDKEAYLVAKALGVKFIFFTKDKNGYRITKSRMKDFLTKNDFKKSFCIGDAHDRAHAIRLIKTTYEKIPRKCRTYYFGDSISDVSIANDRSWGKKYTDKFYAPRNAPRFVKAYSDYVAPHNGGCGGFADMVWHILMQCDKSVRAKECVSELDNTAKVLY